MFCFDFDYGPFLTMTRNDHSVYILAVKKTTLKGVVCERLHRLKQNIMTIDHDDGLLRNMILKLFKRMTRATFIKNIIS